MPLQSSLTCQKSKKKRDFKATVYLQFRVVMGLEFYLSDVFSYTLDLALVVLKETSILHN